MTLRKGTVAIGQQLNSSKSHDFNLLRWITFVLAKNKPDAHQDQKSER